MAGMSRAVTVDYDPSNKGSYIWIASVWHWDGSQKTEQLWHYAFPTLALAKAHFSIWADVEINKGQWCVDEGQWVLYLRPGNIVKGYAVALKMLLLDLGAK